MSMRDNSRNSNKNSEFEERVLQIKRVSKKTSGGNKIGFTALVLLGDRNGKVGLGYGKAPDVSSAISKGVGAAKKNMIDVKVEGNTIPHIISAKFGSAKILLKPAPKGTGIIAGGSVRTVVELAGIKDISAKMIGSSNKMCNIKGTLEALRKLKG